jgi:hypothetical protein
MKEDSLQGGEHTAHIGKLQGVIARDQGESRFLIAQTMDRIWYTPHCPPGRSWLQTQ